VAGDLAGQSAGRIQAFGYLPSHPPRGVKEDAKRFPYRLSSPGTDFTPLEPLQAWTDLIAASVTPADIRLICYAPGDIARAECAMALALGARVGLVQDHALPKDWQFDTTPWADAANLLALPLDAMTLRAFLQIDLKALSNADLARLEPAARMAHEDYVKSAMPKEPSLQPWDKLDEGLKLSNYCQVAYWERTLREYGLGVRPLYAEDRKREPLVMEHVLPKVGSKDPIAELAELEHGRWNVERLAFGWQYSPDKDIARKLSPWLIPWDQVPPEIQKYDIDAIHGLPKKLREVGLELYRL